MKKYAPALLALAALAVLSALTARAQTNVSEFFDYSASGNSSVVGLSGGSNWSGNWSVNGTANGFFQSTNLARSQSGYMNPTVANNGSLGLIDINNTGNYAANNEARTFTPGTDTTMWVSYLFNLGDYSTTTQAYLLFNTNINNSIRIAGTGSNLRITPYYNSSAGTNTDISSSAGNTFLMVAKFTLTAGNDSYSLWVNPTNLTNGEVGLGAANYTSASSASLFGSGAQAMGWGFRSSTGADAFIDNFRLSYGHIGDAGLNAVLAGPVTPVYWRPQANGTFGTATNWSTTASSYSSNANTIDAYWIDATFNQASYAYQPVITTDGSAGSNSVGRVALTDASAAVTFSTNGANSRLGIRGSTNGAFIVNGSANNLTFDTDVYLGRQGTSTSLDAQLQATNTGKVIFNGSVNAIANNLNTVQFNNGGTFEFNGAVNLSDMASGQIILSSGATVAFNHATMGANNEILLSGAGATVNVGAAMNNGTFTLGSSTANNANLVVISNGLTVARGVGSGNAASGSQTHKLGMSVAGTAASTWSGNVDLANGAATTTFQLDAAADNTFTITGVIGAGGSSTTLQKTGAGIVVLGGSSANTYSSSTAMQVNVGTLALAKSSGNALAGNVSLASGATLRLDAADQIADTSTLTFSDGGTFNLNGNSETVSALAGTGGTVRNGSAVTATLSVGGGNGSGSWSGSIEDGTGALVLVKTGTGTQTLTGANSYTGGTLLSAGALKGDTTSLQGAITNNAAAIFDTATNGTYAGTMSGTGTVAKAGAGTLTLTATNTYNGATTVETGKLVVNGAISNSAVTVQSGATLGGSGVVGSTIIQSGGTIAPGNSPGIETINGNLTWESGAKYDWEIFSLTDDPGTSWDLINVTNGGVLNLANLSTTNKFTINLFTLSALPNTRGMLTGFNSSSNYSWKILSSASISDTNKVNLSYFAINAAGFSNAPTDGLFGLELGAGNTSLYLTYTGGSAVPEPGTWVAAALLAGAAGFVRWSKRRRL